MKIKEDTIVKWQIYLPLIVLLSYILFLPIKALIITFFYGDENLLLIHECVHNILIIILIIYYGLLFMVVIIGFILNFLISKKVFNKYWNKINQIIIPHNYEPDIYSINISNYDDFKNYLTSVINKEFRRYKVTKHKNDDNIQFFALSSKCNLVVAYTNNFDYTFINKVFKFGDYHRIRRNRSPFLFNVPIIYVFIVDESSTIFDEFVNYKVDNCYTIGEYYLGISIKDNRLYFVDEIISAFDNTPFKYIFFKRKIVKILNKYLNERINKYNY